MSIMLVMTLPFLLVILKFSDSIGLVLTQYATPASTTVETCNSHKS